MRNNSIFPGLSMCLQKEYFGDPFGSLPSSFRISLFNDDLFSKSSEFVEKELRSLMKKTSITLCKRGMFDVFRKQIVLFGDKS